MRVFVYEFVTGGGLYHRSDQAPLHSWIAEGAAMLAALCQDLQQVPRVEVHALWDERLPTAQRPAVNWRSVRSAAEELQAFDGLAAQCDRTLVIAPESDGLLVNRCQRAIDRGAALISPGPDLVALASDKCATAAWLQRAGVPVPATYRCRCRHDLPDHLAWPAVLKPNDGAGSQDVQRVTVAQAQQRLDGTRDYCLQDYCAGRAASVAALCGPRQTVVLPPCWQHLEPDTFAYLGGSLIRDRTLAVRARRLARRAFACLPAPVGYLGLDLVLGSRADGSADYAIEINPRLTTSYVGLRAAARQNLAAAMLRVAAGRSVELSFRAEPLEFEASGACRRGGSHVKPCS